MRWRKGVLGPFRQFITELLVNGLSIGPPLGPGYCEVTVLVSFVDEKAEKITEVQQKTFNRQEVLGFVFI